MKVAVNEITIVRVIYIFIPTSLVLYKISNTGMDDDNNIGGGVWLDNFQRLISSKCF